MLVFFIFIVYYSIKVLYIQFYVVYLVFLKQFLMRRWTMKPLINENGARNSFGYYDSIAREIILKRPCSRKVDLQEAYEWIRQASDLRKLSIGIGAFENILAGDTNNALYDDARNAIKQTVLSQSAADGAILENALVRLMEKDSLRNLSLKCFSFSENQSLFDLLIKTIKEKTSLVYLNLTGCFFTDEQLIVLANVIADSNIASIVWPEPRMTSMLLAKIEEIFKRNKSIVVIAGVPLEMSTIVEANKVALLARGRYPSLMTNEDAVVLKKHAESVRIAIAHEKQKLYDIEKALEAVIA